MHRARSASTARGEDSSREEGRGVATIIEMVVHTRLDCVLGSASLIREAVAQATHHCAHRAAFGKLLVDQPLMQNVLADLCIESEAATVGALRLARAFDEGDEFRRVATAVLKYWVCKRAPAAVGEALECLGGNGFVEESGLPRLYRESPVNALWEGSSNVQCLDVLRALRREPTAAEGFVAELEERDRPSRRARARRRGGGLGTAPRRDDGRRPARDAARSPRRPCVSRRRSVRASASVRSARCRTGCRSPRSSSGTGLSCSSANGAAPESNRASVGLPHLTGFEDRLGHRAHATPGLGS